MPSVIVCPACRNSLRLPDELLGRKVRCPTCGEAFQSTAAPSMPSAPPPPAAAPPPAPAASPFGFALNLSLDDPVPATAPASSTAAPAAPAARPVPVPASADVPPLSVP